MNDNNQYLIYEDDILKGKEGEDIFIKYLKENNIPFEDVSKNPEYMNIDVDFVIKGRNYDVKHNYKNNELLVIELWYNAEPKFGSLKQGWFYTSQSKFFVFTSDECIIFLKNNHKLKSWFLQNKDNYHLSRNRPTSNKRKNEIHESAYIRIPIQDIPSELIKIIN